MSTEYNPITAKHYAAYRPSLHLPILKKVLGNAHFTLGLDVGCGTGQSALALTHFCDKVIAIDPSASMLQNAMPQDQIEYQHCNGQDLEFDASTFDIITFAGSLYYAKSRHLINEVLKVAKPAGNIVIYDFEILLRETLNQLGVTPPTKKELDYDHEVDFSDLDIQNLHLKNKVKTRIAFGINSVNLGHLLLADSDHYAILTGKFGETNVYAKLLAQLENLVKEVDHQIDAHIFYTQYSSK
jgi:SAM-dependent methyltransferase